MKEGWTYRQLGDVCEILDSKRKPITKGKREPGSIPYYGATGCLDYVKDYIFDEKLVLLGEDGAKWGPGESSAYIINGKSWVNNHAHALRPKREIILDEILVYYLNYSNLQTFITGVTVPKLNQEKMRSIEVPIAPISEQERIVERLDAAFAQIGELKSNAEKQLAEARALFQSALIQAMQPKPGWQEKKLVNVCDIFGRIGFRGYTTKDLVSSQNDGAISLSPSNIQNGEMDYSKRTYISWFKYNESPEIKIFNGDILLVKTGSSYGKSALVKDLPHEATINPQSVVLKNFRINNEFFAYQLRTERVKKEFDQFVSGTAIPTFSQAKLGTVPIYFPGEIEQEQIVSYLNSLNNHVKELEETSRKTAAECDELKQALLRQIFE